MENIKEFRDIRLNAEMTISTEKFVWKIYSTKTEYIVAIHGHESGKVGITLENKVSLEHALKILRMIYPQLNNKPVKVACCHPKQVADLAPKYKENVLLNHTSGKVILSVSDSVLTIRTSN